MNFDYYIAGVFIRLISETLLIEKHNSEIFRYEKGGEPQICCEVISVPVLPEVSGKLLRNALDTRLYEDGDDLFLQTVDRKDNTPIFLSGYSKTKSEPFKLWTLKSQYPHTARTQAIWSAMDLPYQLLLNGVLTLHSAAIEVEDKAVVFMAPSGTGKSTQARLWHELRGVRELNGDKTAFFCKGGQMIAGGVPFCGTSGICVNYEMPVKAIVVLSQAKENSIRRLTGIRALRALLENSFGHKSVPECTEKMIQIAVQILQEIPVYALACTPDERAVRILEEELRKG